MKYIQYPFLLRTGVFSVLLLLFIIACKHEPLVDPGNGNGNNNSGTPCDPDSVYFSQQVQPILSSNCAMLGCHDAITHEEGIILDNYTNTINTGKIKVNDPTDSEIYEVLIDSDPDDRMPPAPRQALTTEQQQIILKWIQQGAQNLSCETGCDTSNVTFSAHIMPIVQLKCKGCHSGSSPLGGISLTNYAQVKNIASNGKLIGSITHQSGFKPMPYPAGSSKLPDCDIAKFKIWISQGALDN